MLDGRHGVAGLRVAVGQRQSEPVVGVIGESRGQFLARIGSGGSSWHLAGGGLGLRLARVLHGNENDDERGDEDSGAGQDALVQAAGFGFRLALFARRPLGRSRCRSRWFALLRFRWRAELGEIGLGRGQFRLVAASQTGGRLFIDLSVVDLLGEFLEIGAGEFRAGNGPVVRLLIESAHT